jgi:predicted enzyme related to lactoylglutathione lyase
MPAKTAGVADFYGTVFGWKSGDAGMASWRSMMRAAWRTWVKESDRRTNGPDLHHGGCPQTLRQIEAAGGRVLTPRTDIGAGMGAFAVFADPVGNEFGLYEEPRG